MSAVDIIIEAASWLLILGGSFFTLAGAFGLVRMPDVYTRMHAVSVTDTLGVGLLSFGMMLQAGLTLVTVKLVFLVILFLFTTPVMTHALAQVCRHEKIRPILSEDRRKKSAGQGGAP